MTHEASENFKLGTDLGGYLLRANLPQIAGTVVAALQAACMIPSLNLVADLACVDEIVPTFRAEAQRLQLPNGTMVR
ncbi:hypothetical protein D3876_10520 [Sphingomonas cavernae]|uniref:Uncharacterized protein n=1 Tax=Sphingomonas cavernae TaxID=2320861 RepID=A0A418WL18_9SPHN|nr:hypothetical protein D3876_10520 [Sphingomonas cavernae]